MAEPFRPVSPDETGPIAPPSEAPTQRGLHAVPDIVGQDLHPNVKAPDSPAGLGLPSSVELPERPTQGPGGGPPGGDDGGDQTGTRPARRTFFEWVADKPLPVKVGAGVTIVGAPVGIYTLLQSSESSKSDPSGVAVTATNEDGIPTQVTVRAQAPQPTETTVAKASEPTTSSTLGPRTPEEAAGYSAQKIEDLASKLKYDSGELPLSDGTTLTMRGYVDGNYNPANAQGIYNEAARVIAMEAPADIPTAVDGPTTSKEPNIMPGVKKRVVILARREDLPKTTPAAGETFMSPTEPGTMITIIAVTPDAKTGKADAKTARSVFAKEAIQQHLAYDVTPDQREIIVASLGVRINLGPAGYQGYFDDQGGKFTLVEKVRPLIRPDAPIMAKVGQVGSPVG